MSKRLLPRLASPIVDTGRALIHGLLAWFLLRRQPRHFAPGALFWLIMLTFATDMAWEWIEQAGQIAGRFNHRTALLALGSWLGVGLACWLAAGRVQIAWRLWCIAAALFWWMAAFAPGLEQLYAWLALQREAWAPDSPWLDWIPYAGVFAWSLLALARQARAQFRLSWPRTLCLPILVFAVSLWSALYGGNLQYWYWSSPEEEIAQPETPPPPPFDEALLYLQPELLHAALEAMPAQRPDQADLYAVSIAGDGSQGVFWRESELAAERFQTRLGARHTVLLQNRYDEQQKSPLATRTSLDATLQRLGRIIDREQDAVLVFMTSHGSSDYEFLLQQPPLEMAPLTPEWLKQSFERAGIRHRLVIVSACYAGGYIAPLADPDTLLITAADDAHSSFGCSDESELTWFGRALLQNALERPATLENAFWAAKADVAKWEATEKYDPSNPQIYIGARIGAKLKAMGLLGRLPNENEMKIFSFKAASKEAGKSKK